MKNEADHLPNVRILIRSSNTRLKISEFSCHHQSQKSPCIVHKTWRRCDLDTCQLEINMRNTFSDNNCPASITLAPIRIKKIVENNNETQLRCLYRSSPLLRTVCTTSHEDVARNTKEEPAASRRYLLGATSPFVLASFRYNQL